MIWIDQRGSIQIMKIWSFYPIVEIAACTRSGTLARPA